MRTLVLISTLCFAVLVWVTVMVAKIFRSASPSSETIEQSLLRDGSSTEHR